MNLNVQDAQTVGEICVGGAENSQDDNFREQSNVLMAKMPLENKAPYTKESDKEFN